MDTSSLLLAVVALLVGVALGFLLARQSAATRTARAEAERDAAVQRAADVTADREQLAHQFRALSADALEKQTHQADRAAELRLTPISEALRQLQQRLAEVEKQRTALAAELRQQVEGVRVSGEAVRKEAASLASALRAPHVRGAWGESSLRRIAEVAGLVEHCHFETQTSYTSSEGNRLRPDMRIDLDGGRAVFVDSKVPLSAVLEACQAEDEEERAAHLRRFVRHVRTHIDQLSAKEYWALDAGSDEFYRLALEQQPTLHEYAATRRITLAGPGLLIPLLQIISHGWRQSRLADSATRISALGRELYSRLATLGSHFEKLGASINGTVKNYNAAMGTLESRVLVSARRFRALDVSMDELPHLNSVDEGVRAPVAPELTAPPEAG